MFEEFKKFVDKKKEIYDGDIVVLIEKEIYVIDFEVWLLIFFDVKFVMG